MIACLRAGKNVVCEKPVAMNAAELEEIIAAAKEAGRVFSVHQNRRWDRDYRMVRRLLEEKTLGEPIGAAAFMICRGHESWHPDPAFYYQHGGGPMMDMGPYYLTAMINLLGGVSSVMGVTKASFPMRTITSQPKCGEVVKVEVPTYVTGILNFENGATGTIFTTFDVCYPGQARLEIYGTKGTLFAPDPNTFGGPVRLLRQEGGEVREVPLCFDYAENSRALGLADMAKALRTGRDPRESWKQTLHVLEIMQSFEKSSRSGAAVAIESKYTRGEPMSDEGVRGILN